MQPNMSLHTRHHLVMFLYKVFICDSLHKENNRERTFVTDAVCLGGKELDESAFFEERLKSAMTGATTLAMAPETVKVCIIN